MNNPKSCPFCQIISGAIDKTILFENETGFVARDGFPITQGHTLIIHKQHIGSFFGISQTQRQDLFALADLAKTELDQEYAPVIVSSVENILKTLVDAPSRQVEAGGQTEENTRTTNPAYNANRYSPPKVDYLAQETMNQALGLSGEEHVVNYEKARLIFAGQETLADKIEHISLEDDRVGYDIHSYNTNGKDRFIEVKTTNYDRYRQFYISPNELKVSQKLGQDYHLYRVFNFKTSPKLFISQGSLDNGYNLSPSAYCATIK